MDMGSMAPPSGPAPAMKARYMHMTFFWGTKTEVLFTLWPGARGGGMYALALIFVFALGAILELRGGGRALDDWLVRRRARPAAAAAVRTAVHAVRVGVAYLIMLALMSFNGGVFLVAVAGHVVGFLAFRTGLCGGGPSPVEEDRKYDPVCCS
ncbi:hypothetical protein GUJ93_ZPchr0393g29137 [Zizania palustris]|uniref:Copper transport protein n=1 Tax=Zizania palustris TaxID=103762 RepID=A0A8J5QW65_ZIZPA|nr:hypothetical protein GUJ93_ZPchr0393g29137 [Zizania palustris]